MTTVAGARPKRHQQQQPCCRICRCHDSGDIRVSGARGVVRRQDAHHNYQDVEACSEVAGEIVRVGGRETTCGRPAVSDVAEGSG